MPRPFDVVAFDLDGTLADTAPDIAVALNRTLDALGRQAVPPDQVRAMIGGGARSLLRRALAVTGTADEALIERGYDLYLDAYADRIRVGTRVYAGVEEALDRLAGEGARLALCTNKPERLTRALLDALGWQDRFDAVVGGDPLPLRKPDPAPLLESVRRAGGGSAAFVGDSITDADTARAAGLPFVAVSFGFSDRPVHELGADAVIDGFDQLAVCLAGLAAEPNVWLPRLSGAQRIRVVPPAGG